eukprot:TRINITY_DN6063_c0_g1_i1.p1 TRINITY_DN6063_c0_g1~~TRINITY_DN6063_c0_g1_i1.p1  ORF type:complete len:751 (-),score=157.74 TRINITY_DN6063_c0_g1_i1:146-2398(-)
MPQDKKQDKEDQVIEKKDFEAYIGARKRVNAAKSEVKRHEDEIVEIGKKSVNPENVRVELDAEKDKLKKALDELVEAERQLKTAKESLGGNEAKASPDFDILTGRWIGNVFPPDSDTLWTSSLKRTFVDALMGPQLECIYRSYEHRMLAETMDLQGICENNDLLPIGVNYTMPDDAVEFDEFCSKLHDKLYTTKATNTDGWRGTAIVESDTTISGMKRLLTAHKLVKKEANKAPPTKAQLKDLQTKKNELFEEELKDLDSSSFEAFSKIDDMLTKLAEKARNAPASMRALLVQQHQSLLDKKERMSYIDAISQGQKKDAVAEVDRLYQEMWSPTQRLFKDIIAKGSVAKVSQLPVQAIGVNYSFQDWAEDDAPATSVLVMPQISPMEFASAKAEERLATRSSIAGLEAQISKLDAKIKQAKTDKDVDEEKQLSDRKEMNEQLLEQWKQQQQDEDENSKEMIARQKQNLAALAARQNQPDASEFLSKGKHVKPLWTSEVAVRGDGNFTSCYKSYIHNEASSSKMVEAYSEASALGYSVSVGWGPFRVSVGGAQSDATSRSGLKDNKWGQGDAIALSFEYLDAAVQNELWDKLSEVLSDDGWYLEGKAPGFLWDSTGKNARFVIKRIIFVQKFAFYSSNSSFSDEFLSNAEEHSKSTSVEVGAGATDGLRSVGGSFGYSGSSSSTKGNQKSDMKLKAGKKTITRPNISIKFLLLEPICPAPLIDGCKPPSEDLTADECKELAKAFFDKLPSF